MQCTLSHRLDLGCKLRNLSKNLHGMATANKSALNHFSSRCDSRTACALRLSLAPGDFADCILKACSCSDNMLASFYWRSVWRTACCWLLWWRGMYIIKTVKMCKYDVPLAMRTMMMMMIVTHCHAHFDCRYL